FLHLAYNAPHFPLQAFPEDIARCRNRYAAGYEEIRRQRFARMRDQGILQPDWKLPVPEKKTSDWRYDYESAPWATVEARDREQRLIEIYAAMVERMDRGIGRVMDALRSTGADSNTIVFFLSDNGGCATLPRDADMPFHVDFNRGKQLGS